MIIQIWENWVLVPWKADVGISDDLRQVLIVFLLEGAPRAPQGLHQSSQWFQMDKIMFHEKSGYNILLWDLTMGKLGVCPMEGRPRNMI